MQKSLVMAPPDRLMQLADLLQQASQLARELSQSRVQIPRDQAWFWTDAWQAKERAADDALAKGEYKEFDTVAEVLADLHAPI